MQRQMKALFISEHEVGSEEWCLDIRKYVADQAKSFQELFPPPQHIIQQANRVRHIIFKYWLQACNDDLSPETIGGCDAASGFMRDGALLLEREEDIEAISKKMRALTARCKCNQGCSTRHCSCLKRGVGCIGCECNFLKCQNKVSEVPTGVMEAVHREESENPENGDENYRECTLEPTHANLAELAEESFVNLSALATTENDVAELLNMLD